MLGETAHRLDCMDVVGRPRQAPKPGSASRQDSVGSITNTVLLVEQNAFKILLTYGGWPQDMLKETDHAHLLRILGVKVNRRQLPCSTQDLPEQVIVNQLHFV